MSRYLGAGHAVRCLLLGSGPLKRVTDRVEVVLRLLVVVGVLVAGPVGMATGSLAHDRMTTSAAATRAALTEVTATLTGNAPTPPGGSAQDTIFAPATWQAPDGRPVQGTVLVVAIARAGTQVGVWVDADGQRRPPPPSTRDIAVQAVVVGLVATLGSAAAGAAALWAGRALLDRSRARRWALGWAAVEPTWRRQLRRRVPSWPRWRACAGRH